MTARTDLLQAARELTAAGASLFSPDELIVVARRNGNKNKESTLRTHIVSHMCANAPANEATGVGEFIRVGSALYKLNDSISRPTPIEVDSSTETLKEAEPITSPSVYPHLGENTPKDWYWEGHVQALVVAHLTKTGWSIRRVADTESSEHGHDIAADRSGERLLVEVKGYPTSTYARGERQGSARTLGSLGAQARSYFSSALLSGCVMRAENALAKVVLVFPAKETFTALAHRVGPVLLDAGIEIWLVEEDGTVTEDVGRSV